MNYFSVQVPVSLRPGWMCHCSDISLCLLSSKPADYPQSLVEGTTTGWRLTDDHSSDVQRCVCLLGEVSGTRPPALLINKFMSERSTKWLLEGFQCHPSLSPAISLLQQRGAEQNYLPPVNNKEVYETWRMRWHTTWNTNEEGAQRSKCYILISTVTLYYAVDSPEGHIVGAEWTKTVLWDVTDDNWERHEGMNGPMAETRHHSGRGGGANSVTCAQIRSHTRGICISRRCQKKRVRDSDTISCCMSELVNAHQTRTWCDRRWGNV